MELQINTVTAIAVVCSAMLLVRCTQLENQLLKVLEQNLSTSTQKQQAVSAAQTTIPSQTNGTVSIDSTISNNKKLRAILHVGPHKTGSTTIQTFLWENRREMLEDNFDAPKKYNGGLHTIYKSDANLAICLHNPNFTIAGRGLNCNAVFKSAKEFLNTSYTNGKHVFFSSEEFSRPGVDMEVFNQLFENYDVEIVVVYRRFYEYIYSFYTEIHKPTRLIFGNGGIEELLSRQTFDTWLTSDIIKQWQLSFTIAARDRFQQNMILQHSKNTVQIYNWYDMVSPNDLLPQFMCGAIRGMPNTCELAKSIAAKELESSKSDTVKNRGLPMDPENLIAEAHRKGMLDWGKIIVKRNYDNIVTSTATFISQKSSEFEENSKVNATVCVDPAVSQELLEVSKQLEIESNVVMSNARVKSIEEDYQSSFTFCVLNVKEFLTTYETQLLQLFSTF